MSNPNAMRSPNAEKSQFQWRVLISALFVLAALLGISSRYYFLQIIDHDRYKLASERNRINVRPVAPSRGLIFDRNGEVLAENWPSYALQLQPEFIDDLDTTLALLQQRIEISDDQLASFRKRYSRTRSYKRVTLKNSLSDTEIAKIAVDSHLLDGVFVEAIAQRHYPRHDVFAHSVGYMGRISERELDRLDPENYANTRFIGKTGVERFYETKLHGTVGYEHVETNARGRVLRVLSTEPATPGINLTLHLDSHLQTVAYEQLGQRRGSVVVIDVETGGVLAMVSTPGFNPNLFVDGISSKEYNRLNTSRDLPLFNRSVRGQYPPGSTVKPMIALAGLEYGLVSARTRISDPGWYQLPNDERLYRDWKKEGHGHVNLYDSVVQSCDIYYYDLANRMGIDRMHDFLANFGFGRSTGIDMIGEKVGILPSSSWKKRTKRRVWYPGETLSVGIGQGYFLVTPLQLAVATAVLANRGKYIEPRLVKAIDGVDLPPSPQTEFEVKHNSYWSQVWRAMEGVVHSPRGTANRISRNIDYKMAGKTGTAQVVGIAQDEEYDSEALAERHRDHALFVSFAPLPDPKIAVAVIVENGEAGSSVAAPVARAVTDAWLKQSKPKG